MAVRSPASNSVVNIQGTGRVGWRCDAGIEVAGRCGDADALRHMVAARHPDVAIVDIRMPPNRRDDGLVAAQEIRRDHPDTGVLVLSHHLEPRYAARLLEDVPGKAGYLTAREREVLKLIAEGHSNKAIGERLFLSHKTVEAHISQIFLKLDLRDTPDQHRRVLAVLAHLRS